MEQQNYINSVNLNKNTNFPYLVLDGVDGNSYPRNPGFQVMHWHEDLQFIAVLSGEAKVVTLEKSVLLHSGEGAFINKNVVHLVRKNGSCHYKSFGFPDFFLKFYTDCPANRIVEQWAGKENFPFFHIENREEHRKVLALLQKLSNLGRQETPFYAYEVLTMLRALWLEFCRVAPLPQVSLPKSIVEERMTAFLRYIEQHYAEPVSLDALAESAHVSKSECLRCFKASLQTAPYQYLTEYRLSKAAELLEHTDLPISEIAIRAGFSQTSHFGKHFRGQTGMSPSAYRKAKKEK